MAAQPGTMAGPGELAGSIHGIQQLPTIRENITFEGLADTAAVKCAVFPTATLLTIIEIRSSKQILLTA